MSREDGGLKSRTIEGKRTVANLSVSRKQLEAKDRGINNIPVLRRRAGECGKELVYNMPLTKTI